MVAETHLLPGPYPPSHSLLVESLQGYLLVSASLNSCFLTHALLYLSSSCDTYYLPPFHTTLVMGHFPRGVFSGMQRHTIPCPERSSPQGKQGCGFLDMFQHLSDVISAPEPQLVLLGHCLLNRCGLGYDT